MQREPETLKHIRKWAQIERGGGAGDDTDYPAPRPGLCSEECPHPSPTTNGVVDLKAAWSMLSSKPAPLNSVLWVKYGADQNALRAISQVFTMKAWLGF